MNQLNLPEYIRPFFGADPFAEIMQMQGKIFRDVKGRKTIQVTIGGNSYFIKQHFGVGWGDIFKSYLSFKTPVLGALTEVAAIQKLDEIGIPTTPLVGYGVRGNNPAKQQSFIITQDLGDITSLEDVCADWKTNPPDTSFKQQVMIKMAQLAAKLHSAGLCHRDFYLCHLALKKAELAAGMLNLHLIDLHRMLQGQSPSGNTVMKDVAGLKFSCLQNGLTHEDFEIFKQHYLQQNEAFWQKVEPRVVSLLAKFFSKKFQQRLIDEKSKLNKF
ncbi:MAG TPA: lipopolysaccharide core heptose(I) kinase RfaP [Methylotenera sp.]|nr:lipopolysaccharide core heptose(I) kinase RfaP [Methylotenera sp.]HPH06027.1 lipopolysaccharide core heptose(I) kinase RfaP [Methylotenera sp.]HPN00605.1 lipopolysaccharide core heptose(I) kinase RfaP [Methylotenera sp.]